MMDLGFCVFGRPIAHSFVSNGLATELNIGDETYLDHNFIELQDGERLIKISRKVEKGNEIIKIYIFDYAISFNDRSGGFIGSACVFACQPTQKLLYSAIRYVHDKTAQLIDENKKFRFKELTSEANEVLYDPNTDGLIQGSPRKLTQQPSNNNLYTVLTDGPVLNHLMSVVQGFMYNPNFSNIESIYVSDNKILLDRITKKNNKKILGIGHLLNFQNYFTKQNEILNESKAELVALKKEIESKKANKDTEITQHIDEKKRELNIIINEKNSKEKKIEEINKKGEELTRKVLHLKTNFENAKQEKVKLDSMIKQLVEKKDKLSNESQINFNKIINDDKYQVEKDNLIRNSSLYKKLLKDKEELEKELTKAQKKSVESDKKRLIRIGGAIFIILFAGYMFGNYLPFSNKKNIIYVETTENKNNTETENSSDKIKFGELPKEYTTKDYMQLSDSGKYSHSLKLDGFMKKMEDEKPEIEDYDLTSFFDRKWNFAELIDVEKFDNNLMDPGLERIVKIKSLYKKYNKPTDVFDDKFALAELDDELIPKEIDFGTSKRNVILNKYFTKSNNIYSKLGLNVSTKDYTDYEKDHRLIYMHFRWMVYNLSDYTDDSNSVKSGDANLKTTNKTKHKVLLIK